LSFNVTICEDNVTSNIILTNLKKDKAARKAAYLFPVDTSSRIIHLLKQGVYKWEQK